MKTYTIRTTRIRHDGSVVKHDYTGTLEQLTQDFSYTLLKGQSWEHERGNRKINTQPKTIRSLITNLNNAEDNASRTGYGSTAYDLVEA